jgi:hypothetical protein
VSVKNAPFEVRQQHELAGRIALAEKRYPAAAEELSQANQQDPVILYLTALAWRGAGDAQKAAALDTKAAKFNGLSFNSVYLKNKAGKMSSTSSSSE